MLTTAKFCWTGQETFEGNVEIANYGEHSLKGKSVSWELKTGKRSLGKGKMSVPSGLGLLTAGTIRLTLPDIEKACKAELSLKIAGTSYRNTYPLWIYPAKKQLKTACLLNLMQVPKNSLAVNKIISNGKSERPETDFVRLPVFFEE